MIRYLIDTNIISELSRHSPDKKVLDWASSVNRCGLSVITVEELYFGLSWRPNPRVMDWIERFVDEFCEILPITRSISQRAGILRGQFQGANITRTQADLLIAATAAELCLTLVTRNLKDFEGCGVALLDPFVGI
jgi:predicted nucleic acid-binding protein